MFFAKNHTKGFSFRYSLFLIILISAFYYTNTTNANSYPSNYHYTVKEFYVHSEYQQSLSILFNKMYKTLYDFSIFSLFSSNSSVSLECSDNDWDPTPGEFTIAPGESTIAQNITYFPSEGNYGPVCSISFQAIALTTNSNATIQMRYYDYESTYTTEEFSFFFSIVLPAIFTLTLVIKKK